MLSQAAQTTIFFSLLAQLTTVTSPNDMLMSIDLKEGFAARQSITYDVANGVRIANFGEKAFVGITGDGQEKQINAQVCEVNKALLRVSTAVYVGNVVYVGRVIYTFIVI